jgi:hypothetical protein
MSRKSENRFSDPGTRKPKILERSPLRLQRDALYGMIPKSVQRFSEKDRAQTKG